MFFHVACDFAFICSANQNGYIWVSGECVCVCVCVCVFVCARVRVCV